MVLPLIVAVPPSIAVPQGSLINASALWVRDIEI